MPHPEHRRSVLYILLAVAALFAGGACAWAAVKVGDAFPDLATFKLEGALPADITNKVVMIDFWASWCDPCKDSFPVMDELQKRYGPKGFAIVAINVDEKRTEMEDFLKKNKVSFTLVRDATQKLVEKIGISTMPSSFILDRSGKVRFYHPGYRGNETRKKYEQEIESLVGKP